MRYLGDGRPVYTATDLCDYLACGHLVTLKRLVASGERIQSVRIGNYGEFQIGTTTLMLTISDVFSPA